MDLRGTRQGGGCFCRVCVYALRAGSGLMEVREGGTGTGGGGVGGRHLRCACREEGCLDRVTGFVLTHCLQPVCASREKIRGAVMLCVDTESTWVHASSLTLSC